MKIIIRAVSSEITLQTVSVAQNNNNPDNLYLFRCYHCGTAVAQIKGNISGISAGLIPTDQVIVIFKCHICGENYTFQSVKTKSQRIRLILSPQLGRTISTFMCIICRTDCLTYKTDVKVPFDFECTNYTCGKKYKMIDVVSLTDVVE